MFPADTPVATHLERALGEDFTARLARRLEDAGLELDRPFPSRVRVKDVVDWLELVREEVYPSLPRGEGLRRVGRRALDGLGRNFPEQAALALLRFVGPDRALKQAEGRFRDSSLGLRVIRKEKCNAEIQLADAQGMPEMIQGLLEAIGPRIGAMGTTVDFEPEGEKGAKFSVKWR